MLKSLYLPERQILLELLVEARKGAGLTQVQMAASLGWTQGMVSKVEKGDRTLDMVELRQWLLLLGQDLAAFSEVWTECIEAHKAASSIHAGGHGARAT